MQQVASKRMKVYEFEEFSVDLEYNEYFVALHIPEVEKFNKKVLRKMKVYVEQLHEFITTLGYQDLFAGIVANDLATERLAEHCGFEYVGEQDAIKVYVYKGIE